LNKWFKTFPYTGWVTIFFVTLVACVTAYHFEKKQYAPARLTAAVQTDFNKREKEVLHDRLYEFSDNSVKANAFKPESDYYIFVVKGGNTMSWNTITVDLPDSIKKNPEAFFKGRLAKLANGYYFIRTFPMACRQHDKYSFTLIPIVYEYPIDNQYFHSSYAAGNHVPVTTLISAEPLPGSYKIINHEGRPVCYLKYTQTADELYIAGPWVWLLALVLIFTLLFWIHECCYYIGLKTGKPVLGWLALLVFLGLLYLLKDRVGYPSGFLNSTFFSPELFSSEGVKSLGDFLITILANLWGLCYLLVYVPLSRINIVKIRWADIAIRLIVSFGLTINIFSHLTDDIRKLIFDSKISFEAGNFFGLNIYTFFGILCLCVITITFLILLGIINALLIKFIKHNLIRYAVFLLMSIFSLFLLSAHEVKTFDLVILMMSIAGLLMIDAFGLPLQKPAKNSGFSIASSTYIWFAILCSWITLEIFFFNYSKEKDLRKLFAIKQEQQDDGLVQYNFITIAEGLMKDTMVMDFLHTGSFEQRNRISKYILYNYLSDYSEDYVVNTYYYDRFRHPIYQVDKSDEMLMSIADSLTGGKFKSGTINVINVRESNHMYWSLCPVIKEKDTVGYVGVDIAVDKSPEVGSQRSFLEKKTNPTDQQYYDNYSFAVYRNNILWTQGGEEIFPYVNDTDHPEKEFTFQDEKVTSSILLLRTSPTELIKVVYKRNLLTNVVSLFSYVLGVLLVLAAILFLMRHLMFYPGKLKFFLNTANFTIRAKINLTILVTVFVSLLVVGIITLSFLNNKYKENQRRNLQSILFFYTQNILKFSEEQRYDFNESTAGFFSAYSDLSYKLNALAEEQGADINLFNKDGKLIATSQIQLFKKGLISQHMKWEVFTSLRKGDESEVMIEDKIGDLQYQSVYTPIRGKDDNILAYVNLPYYASGPERNNEISNVLVALINVYTIVFFLSGICAIIISNSIIKSFRLLIDQFRNIRLRHNEYIEWPYKDEIGILVKEYNDMMRKVEAMAARLARTEREEAWREIARQVAHEIKNPLTPMKLNIQYLQQAILNGRPDIDKLASKVSETLIEQIENLNLIATEFSNFAKMPEARPEVLNLSQSLQSLINLFPQENKLNVTLETGDDGLQILMDKSYFLRIFTNLIQNAIQAIDDTKDGKVTVSYEQKENNVVIKIQDNGSGIPDSMQEKLFLPYFTTKSSGTGLGLPMTKNMVENSNGSIWFDTVENEGSVFYVQLPLHKNNGDDQNVTVTQPETNI
jgi:two-component system nitrogen regulation sensor histidine kinase NtrY